MMLWISKIEAGQLIIERYKFDLHSVIEDVAQIFAPLAKNKSLDLSVKYSPDLPSRFIGDAGRIRQEITNLVANAIKFTSAGSVRIVVACEGLGSESSNVQVSVIDTGIGIQNDKIGSYLTKLVRPAGLLREKPRGWEWAWRFQKNWSN